MKNLLLFTISVIFFTSCDKTIENLDIDFGYDYYPLEVGKYIIYDVDSITYDPTATITSIDTTSYQVKEEIVEKTTDNSGRALFVIHYFTRSNSNDIWELENVYSTVKEDRWVERTEDNLRFVKMLFPQKIDSTWNGNRYFAEDGILIEVRGETLEIFKNWSSLATGKGDSEIIGGLNFDDILTIKHADDENLIERRFVEEKYARGIGLVEKTVMILDTQCGGNLSDCIDLTWKEKAEKGFILKMFIKEHN